MVEVHRVAVDEWTSIKFHKRLSLLEYISTKFFWEMTLWIAARLEIAKLTVSTC